MNGSRTTVGTSRERRVASYPTFTVQSEHLLERLSVGEVEAREMVFDPLHAVPPLPFGHLNRAWQAFLAQRTGNEEIWSFSALWKAGWFSQRRSGYALVRDRVPRCYLLTVLKQLPRAEEEQ